MTAKIIPSNMLKKSDIKQEGERRMACLTITNFYAFVSQVAIILIVSTVTSLAEATPNQQDHDFESVNIFVLQPTPISIKR